MKNWLINCWNNIRRLSGDDAYERYLLQYTAHQHDHQETLLTKKEFFKQWQDGKWKGIKRCC